MGTSIPKAQKENIAAPVPQSPDPIGPPAPKVNTNMGPPQIRPSAMGPPPTRPNAMGPPQPKLHGTMGPPQQRTQGTMGPPQIRNMGPPSQRPPPQGDTFVLGHHSRPITASCFAIQSEFFICFLSYWSNITELPMYTLTEATPFRMWESCKAHTIK